VAAQERELLALETAPRLRAKNATARDNRTIGGLAASDSTASKKGCGFITIPGPPP